MGGAAASSYEVFELNGGFEVRERKTLEVIHKGRDASSAIQFAVDQADAGGQVLLLPGTYPLDRAIRMKDMTELRGSGPSTILSLKRSNQDSMAIMCLSVERVVIADLAISGKRGTGECSGIVLDDCGDCTVRDVFTQNLGAYGVWMRNNSFLCELRGIKAAGSGEAGIFLDRLAGKGRGGDYVPNLVSNCIIYGGKKGILTKRAVVANLVACEVYQTAGPAFHISEQSNSIVISACRSFQIMDDAVVFEDSDEININGSIFCWHDGHGIVLKNATWGSVSGNNIIDTGHFQIDPEEGRKWTYSVTRPDGFDYEAHAKNGILMTRGTRGITVNGNAVFNWGSNVPMRHGIEEDASCLDNVITGNNINYCLKEGISSSGQNSIETSNYSNVEIPYRGAKNIELDRFHRYEKSRIREFIKALD